MKALTGVVILFLAGIQLVQSDTIDLSPGTATVTEGADTTIRVVCAFNPVATLTRDARCALGVMTGVANSAENGWDVADVTGYACTILAGANSGMVDIPLNDDVVIDNAETLTIECAQASTGDAPGTAATFTINDGGMAEAALTLVPRLTHYKVSEEAGMLSIWVDAIDANGNVAPNEDDIDIQLIFPTAATTDTASAGDYDSTVAAITVFGSVNGIATSSFPLDLPMTTDVTLENLETLNVLLTDSTTPASVTSDSTTTISVEILDDDKPELVVVNAYPRLPRRSKQNVFLRAFNALGPWDLFDLTWLPFNLKDCFTDHITTGDGVDVTETTLARPKYRTRDRFNEYKYTTRQIINTVPYSLTAYAYVSTTSHSKPRAPIEASVGPTWTIWPLTVDVTTGDCLTIEPTVISVPPGIYTSSMRWWFIKEGGTISDIRRVTTSSGRNWVRITECRQAGLYIVERRNRGKQGWVDHVRVITAACPEGFMRPPACSTPAPVCYNGGAIDPVLELCSCPPGFAGTNCETVTEQGDFGSNCQFNINDIWPGNRKGKCVAYSFPPPLGVTCATGFGGYDCCKPCNNGFFGPKCAHRCHCVDDHCDPYSGICENGCAPFYFGPNCQRGGPP